MSRTFWFLLCLVLITSCTQASATPSPTQISRTIVETNVPTLTADQVIPDLQVISVTNVEKIHLFRKMEIPNYVRGKISQCNTVFSPDGTRIAAACGINPVPVWEMKSGKVIYSLDTGNSQMVSCAFSPDGAVLACGGFNGKVTVWNMQTGAQIKQMGDIGSPVWDIAFSPDGKSLATCGITDTVRLWNAETGEQEWITDAMEECLSIAFDPGGSVIAYGGLRGMIGVVEASSGKAIGTLDEIKYPVGDIAFNHSGTTLAAGSDDDTIYVWKTGDLKKVEDYILQADLKGHYNYVNGIAFNPDNYLMLSSSHDSSSHLWNMATLKTIKIIGGHSDVILRGAFNDQGTLVATVSWDGTVSLFGIEKGLDAN